MWGGKPGKELMPFLTFQPPFSSHHEPLSTLPSPSQQDGVSEALVALQLGHCVPLAWFCMDLSVEGVSSPDSIHIPLMYWK